MTNLKRLIFISLLLLGSQCFGSPIDSLLWIQQPAVSPDGHWIAFEYKGNVYKVSSEGGNAIPLTINSSYNGYPKWSHDGSQIAFASDRYGNFDVYIMPSAGGEAKRLSYGSTKDIPCDFSADDKQVYYINNAHDVYTSLRFPFDRLWLKLFAVPAEGGRSIMINAAGTENVQFNKTGDKFLFQDRKGDENEYRKHHVSPVTRDIWLCELKSDKYTKLTTFNGEDREPVWGEGSQFYYLSELKGNQNLFKSSIDHPTDITQITSFTKNPVRNLSRSSNGLLVFTQDGDLFTLTDGNQPKK